MHKKNLSFVLLLTQTHLASLYSTSIVVKNDKGMNFASLFCHRSVIKRLIPKLWIAAADVLQRPSRPRWCSLRESRHRGPGQSTPRWTGPARYRRAQRSLACCSVQAHSAYVNEPYLRDRSA